MNLHNAVGMWARFPQKITYRRCSNISIRVAISKEVILTGGATVNCIHLFGKHLVVAHTIGRMFFILIFPSNQ